MNTGTSPKTRFAYQTDVDGSSIYKYGLRRWDVFYPMFSSVQLRHTYFGTVNDRLRRIGYLKLHEGDFIGGVTDSQTLKYAYNGVGRVASMETLGTGAIDAEWTANTAAGVYGNWDGFGRTLNQRWFRSSTTHDQFEYTYDYAGNRLTREIPSTG